MQRLNRFVGGRQEVGHIDLLDTISYFEVPERDAKKVMIQLTGIRYKGRQVRCNDADEGPKPAKPRKPAKPAKPRKSGLSGLSGISGMEGWAMRKPRKKK